MILANRFARNAGWLGGAQLANRVFRLLCTVIVARVLMPEDYGLAAIVITTHECVQMLCRHGVVAKLIQAPSQQLEDLCQAGYWLNWVQGVILFVLQCGLAWGLNRTFQRPELIWPICVLALTYLMLPFAIVQAALTLRENQLRATALIGAIQSGLDVGLTIALAVLGWGFWALVLPKVLVVPVWIIVYRRYHSWRPQRGFGLMACKMSDWRSILRFSLPITGVEILTTLRGNMDYLLVGYCLGVEALGVYFFAFNAGLGISISLIDALGNALFPHLCDANQNPDTLKTYFWNGIKLMGVIMIPMIILQTCLAPFYLPIIFGEKWVHAGALPILIMICLSALPRPFAEASSQLLRAVGRPKLEFVANMVLTSLLLFFLIIAIRSGVQGVAAGILIFHLIFLPAYSVWAYHRAWHEHDKGKKIPIHV